MKIFIPEDYKERVELITKGNNHFYMPSDFKNNSQILLFFSRASGYNPKPDSIRRCLIVDTNAKKLRSGFGIRDALEVEVIESWIVRGGEIEMREIKKPHTKFFYESIMGAYSISYVK